MKISESCPNRICLVGFAGCGKSTIGKKLARKFGYQFIDTDALFEAQEKMTIEDFFEHFGEPVFRQKEYLLLQSLLSIDKCVIATGGGMPCFRDAIDLMLQSATVVYICLSPPQLVKRLQQSKSKRPLFKNCSEAT
ncbi:MAG: shikimate kinase, partial [Bacteroidales bacterium]|nr:shikimate kinase [Bacteroidales bacterium]